MKEDTTEKKEEIYSYLMWGSFVNWAVRLEKIENGERHNLKRANSNFCVATLC